MRVDSFEELVSGGPPNERSWRLLGTPSVFCRVTDLGDRDFSWDAWVPGEAHWEHGGSDTESAAILGAKAAAVRLHVLHGVTGPSETHVSGRARKARAAR